MIRAALVVGVGGAALIVVVVVTYYVISFAVLSIVSKLFPMTGRRRR